MADRVDNSGSSANRVTSNPSKPTEGAKTNQAAADFSALMGSDAQQPNSPSSGSDYNSGYGNYQRVEERQDQQQDSGDDARDDSGGGNKKKEDTHANELAAAREAMLRSMGKGELQAAKIEAPAQPTGPQNLDGIVQQVADKMLVSDMNSTREVRIFLKESILPGTEIRISQQAGKMQVQFVTDATKSQEMLAQHQVALQQRLCDKLDRTDVVVSVEMGAQAESDQQEGRSRGQRDVVEEAEGEG